MDHKKDILWVDLVKVIGTFSVVFLHTAGPFLVQFNNLPLRYWWAGNIYDSMVRMCVPQFFMLTGYLLLGRSESLTAFFSKRVNKVVVPLVAWSIFYIFWRVYYVKNLSLSPRLFYEFLSKPAFYHLWFLYSLIGLYLFVPVLRIVVQNSPDNILYYFTALWFLAVSVIPIYDHVTGIKNTFDLKSVSGFSGYLVIGYLLGKREFSSGIRFAAIGAALVCVGVAAWGTFYLTARDSGRLNEYFYGNLRPNVILQSVAVFVLLKHFGEKLNVSGIDPIIKAVKRLSLASFGIYLVHPVFLRLGWNGELGFSVGSISNDPLYFVPISAILTFTLSFIAASILQKIPILKRSVP